MRILLAPLPALLLLVACADDGKFPSLAPRPIEALASRPEPEPVAPVRATDATLETAVADQARAVAAAEQGWQVGLSAARAAIARPGSRTPQGEAWVQAQQAIGRLDQLRAPMAAAVEAIDRLRFAQADTAMPVSTATLDALWTRAAALATAQDAAYATLSAAIPIS